MFGFIRESAHQAKLKSFVEHSEAHAKKLTEDFLKAAEALRAENTNLRREEVRLRNEIAALKGQLVAEAHASGRPA